MYKIDQKILPTNYYFIFVAYLKYFFPLYLEHLLKIYILDGFLNLRDQKNIFQFTKEFYSQQI